MLGNLIRYTWQPGSQPQTAPGQRRI